MEEGKGKTVGQISSELLQKQHEDVETLEQTRAMLEDYEDNISQTVNEGIKWLGNNVDFFIVVLTKREKTMSNVLRNYFFYRRSCPTPTWDQTVYTYNHSNGVVDLLWTVPCREACKYLHDNRLNVDKEEWQLLEYVLKFQDGTLDLMAKKLNKENYQREGIESCSLE